MSLKNLTLATIASALLWSMPSLAQDSRPKSPKGTDKQSPSSGSQEGEETTQAVRDAHQKLFRNMLKESDKNEDGLLSVQELGDPRVGLLQFDRDGNGKLSAQEFQEERGSSYLELLGRMEKTKWSPSKLEQRMLRYMKRDRDGDRMLTPSEAPELFAVKFDGASDGKISFPELMEYWNANPSERLIRELDLNGDARLSDKEVPELKWKYSQVDNNGDGFVVKTELLNYLEAGSSRRKYDALASHLFKRFDSDHNGTIEDEELGPVTSRYQEVDENGDKKVSKKELENAIWAAKKLQRNLGDRWVRILEHDKDDDIALTAGELPDFEKYARGVDKNKDGVIAIHEIAAHDRSSRDRRKGPGLDFGIFDRNKDGKITKNEQPGFFGKLNLDKDGDGAISEEEFNSHFKKKKKKKSS